MYDVVGSYNWASINPLIVYYYHYTIGSRSILRVSGSSKKIEWARQRKKCPTH